MANHFAWAKGYSRNLILSKISSTRKIDGGRCSFSPAQEYEYWLAVLNSAIRANAIVERDKEQRIRNSLSDGFLTLNNPEGFLDRCDKAYSELAKRQELEFVLYTTITYSGPKLISRISDRDSAIRWQPSADGKFLKNAVAARDTLAPKRSHRKIPDDKQLTPLLAYISAYDVIGAFETAIDRVDRFRGLLNLMMNYQNQLNPLARLSAPHSVNPIRRGPFHTLHKPDGSLATDTFWYEPQWMHDAPTAKFENHAEYAKEFRKWWRRLDHNPLGELISDALLKYCRGMDAHKHEEALLGTWQALEKITGTDNYDMLIDRIIRVFSDPEETRQVANHLRHRRNATVHSGNNDSREAHVIVYQVEQLARGAIFFCLEHGRKFRGQDELHEFLDMPLDIERLKQRDRLTKFFVRYQKELRGPSG
jgi:hypothetical protein